MKMIIALRLPFRALDNIQLKKWIRMACFASSPPQLLSPYQLRESLQEQAILARASVLAKLPEKAKIATALDTWQSPNKLAFMAITGYECLLLLIIAKINTNIAISLMLIGIM